MRARLLVYRDGVTNHLHLLDALSEERRAHSLEVGRKADLAARLVRTEEREDLVTAATLHDIGYGHPVSGFHPLDGAAFLASQGFSALVCHLVAHHSCSVYEADERGIPRSAYEPFAIAAEVNHLHRIVCWADMTTSPTGQTVTVEERLAEIESRYGPEDVVTAFVRRARPRLIDCAQAPSSGSIRG